MDIIDQRRSIRKYKDMPLPKAVVEEILRAGMAAPSSKNRQPWRFTAVTGEARRDMLSAMRRGLLREKNCIALLPGSARYISGAEYTLEIMAQAPVTVLVENILGAGIMEALTPEERIYEMCNMLSIGAALENMTLAATALGVGSLWICDIFFAYEELRAWHGGTGELAAAMTFGYPDESPGPRPRKKMEDAVCWRGWDR